MYECIGSSKGPDDNSFLYCHSCFFRGNCISSTYIFSRPIVEFPWNSHKHLWLGQWFELEIRVLIIGFVFSTSEPWQTAAVPVYSLPYHPCHIRRITKYNDFFKYADFNCSWPQAGRKFVKERRLSGNHQTPTQGEANSTGVWILKAKSKEANLNKLQMLKYLYLRFLIISRNSTYLTTK